MTLRYSPFQPTLAKETAERFGLKIEYLRPCPAFADKVITYLHIRASRPTPYPVFPDSTQAIYLSQYGAFVGGPGVSIIDMQLPHAGEYFGIWFQPGVLRHWLSVDLSEVSGQFIDDNLLPRNQLTELRDTLYDRCPDTIPAAICDRWLLKHFRENSDPRFDNALNSITRSSGNEKIAHVASTVGWSSRNLHRHFIKHTGLAAKEFAQIIRLHHACRQVYAMRCDFSTAMPELGYHDQSHLIKAFNKYFATTPSAYFDRFMSDLYN